MTTKEQANVMVKQVALSLPAVISAIIITIGASRVYYGDRSALVAAQDAKMTAMEARIVSAVADKIAAVERRADDKIKAASAERWTAVNQAKWIALARQRGVNLPDAWEAMTPQNPIGPATTILKD